MGEEVKGGPPSYVCLPDGWTADVAPDGSTQGYYYKMGKGKTGKFSFKLPPRDSKNQGCGAKGMKIEYTASQLEAKKKYHTDMDAAETWPEKKAILVKVQQDAIDAAKRNGQMGRRLLDLRSPALKRFSEAIAGDRKGL